MSMSDGPYTESDVREAKWLLEKLGYEVTPKPAISDEELGRMLADTFRVIGPRFRRGDVFRANLAARGLEIVKVSK
jgi:hypothetical protein